MRPVTTFRDQLGAATTALEAAGVASPRVDAEWLLAGLLGVGRVTVRLDPAGAVPELLAERYGDAVRRRARREPLQRILGWEEFRGLRVRLTDAVLVPRPETEALVEWALALLPAPGGRRLRAVDLGTGSGCIACALAAERPDLDVVAIDVSPAAAAVARENAIALGLAAQVSVAGKHGATPFVMPAPKDTEQVAVEISARGYKEWRGTVGPDHAGHFVVSAVLERE